MKVNDISIEFCNGIIFTIQQNDWESAPCPICMQLVNKENWQAVADVLKTSVNESWSEDIDEEYFDDIIWAEYEKIVLNMCRVFYYEDMTDEEYETYMALKTEEEQDKFANEVYNRIHG